MSNTHYAPGTPLIDADSDAIMSEIQRIYQIPGLAICGELINTLNFIISYPVCNVNTRMLRPICRSQCQMITEQLTQCLMELSSDDFPIVNEILFTDLACEDPESYYIFPLQYISDLSNPSDCLTISKLLHMIICIIICAILHTVSSPPVAPPQTNSTENNNLSKC